MQQVRHGDIMIDPVDRLPEGAVEIERGRVVLALGEATGHSHAITAPREATVIHWDVAGQHYVTVEGGEPLTVWRTADMPATKYLVERGHLDAVSDAVEHRHTVGVILDHEEHGRIAVEEGVGMVRRARVYTPEKVRYVAD